MSEIERPGYRINGVAIALQSSATGRPPDFATLFYVLPHQIEIRLNTRPVLTMAIDRMESQFSDRAVVFIMRCNPPIPTKAGDLVEAYLRAPAEAPPGKTLETPEEIRSAGLRMANSIFMNEEGRQLEEGPELDAFILALERLL